MRRARGLGPPNDVPLAVTQELVALMYADNPIAMAEMARNDAFFAGMTDKPPMEPRYLWETGALAAHLIAIGGQGER